MTTAKASVTAAGAEYQSAAEYPDVSVTAAAVAQAALDDLGTAWAARLSRDDALVDAIGSAFVLVGQALGSVDSDLQSYLEQLGYQSGTP